MFRNLFSLSNLTLLVALALSSVAAYYSIIGLTAIFAGAVIPIIIMGSVLEVGKIATTVWLRKYWNKAGIVLKLYLVPAVILLAFLTSMGIFGFLSKAHSDQGLVSGDVLAKLEVYDEKIKTAKENIQSLRNELKQMDQAVDQVMARSTTEQGADKSNSIRKSQQRDRNRIAKEIEANQKLIGQLNDEAAPIRAEVRKVEAEVGPIKYIAAFIYGDNPDTNLLEAAVRWVIILIVIVFDPLAIALVLAANASKEWDKEVVEEPTPVYTYENTEPPTTEELKEIDEFVEQVAQETLNEVEEVSKDPAPVGWMYAPIATDMPKKEKKTKKKKEVVDEPVVTEIIETPNEVVESKPKFDIDSLTVDSTIKIPEVETKVYREDQGYIEFDGKHMAENVAKTLYPEYFKALPSQSDSKVNFGNSFPKIAQRGEIFTRTDSFPNTVYKFDGQRWISLDKKSSSTYLTQTKYIEYLVNKISTGEYELEMLTDEEQFAIQEYLTQKS